MALVIPTKFYAHGQATSSTVTLNIGQFLSRISTQDVAISLKSASVVIAHTSGTTKNDPLVYTTDITLPNINFPRNESSTATTATVVHTVAMPVQSSGTTGTHYLLYHSEGLENAVIIIPRETLLINSKIDVSLTNTATYGGGTFTVSHFEVMMEFSEVDGDELKQKTK